MDLCRLVFAIEVRSRLRATARGQLDEYDVENCRRTREGLFHALVHQRGTQCPSTLRTAAGLVLC